MTVDFEWKAGLVVGLEADTLYYGETVEDILADDGREVPVWYLHLGFLTVALMFD
jgi:hypothetical protein